LEELLCCGAKLDWGEELLCSKAELKV